MMCMLLIVDAVDDVGDAVCDVNDDVDSVWNVDDICCVDEVDVFFCGNDVCDVTEM